MRSRSFPSRSRIRMSQSGFQLSLSLSLSSVLYFAISILIVISPITSEDGDSSGDINGTDFTETQTENENGEVVFGKTKPDGRFIPSFNLSSDPDDIEFLLYNDASDSNKSESLFLNDSESIETSSFKVDEKTIFIIHGFLSNRSSGMPVTIKQGFMDAEVPYNLFVVDWGKLSTPNPPKPIYEPIAYPIIVKRNIPKVSQRVGEFIQFLVDQKFTTLDKLHIIGHSLGAHVSSGVGGVIMNNPKNDGGKIARISGLDPAGPLFQGIQCQRRISKKDADFVDIYHTAAGTLGTSVYDEGHANFMPNGAHHQPGCTDYLQPIFFESDLGSCSHSFVNKIYAASISKNFKACRCDPSFQDFIMTSKCPGDCEVSALAGYPCPSDTRGQFYFETGEDPKTDDPPEKPMVSKVKKLLEKPKVSNLFGGIKGFIG